MVRKLVRKSSAVLGSAALVAGLVGVLAAPASAAPPPGLSCTTSTSYSWPYYYAHGRCTNYGVEGQWFAVNGVCNVTFENKISPLTLVWPFATETASTAGCRFGFWSITIS